MTFVGWKNRAVALSWEIQVFGRPQSKMTATDRKRFLRPGLHTERKLTVLHHAILLRVFEVKKIVSTDQQNVMQYYNSSVI